MKTLVVMQPTYLPWLGYFELMKQSDVFVFYDHVQFSKQSWQQRNRVYGKAGETMLTVPVIQRQGQPISEVEIDPASNFVRKHLETLKQCYGKAPGFTALFPELAAVYGKGHRLLKDLNCDLIRLGRERLGVGNEFKFSSELGVTGDKVESLVGLCKSVGADRYYSPAGSRGYIEENNLFEKEGIQLDFQAYEHPVYSQGAKEFKSHMAFVDYLFNVPGGRI